VLAIDYRGFADSTGTPSKEGLVVDARAALDWVVERGAKAEEVLIVGLSLGTGVVSALGAELAREGELANVFLDAAFSQSRSSFA
jgi:abhydrolase domain-containing protein 12